MRAQFVDLFQQNGNKKDMCPFIFSRDKGENHTSVLMSKFRKNRVYNIIFIVAGFAVHCKCFVCSFDRRMSTIQIHKQRKVVLTAKNL